jgi:hypothetical protein
MRSSALLSERTGAALRSGLPEVAWIDGKRSAGASVVDITEWQRSVLDRRSRGGRGADGFRQRSLAVGKPNISCRRVGRRPGAPISRQLDRHKRK